MNPGSVIAPLCLAAVVCLTAQPWPSVPIAAQAQAQATLDVVLRTYAADPEHALQLAAGITPETFAAAIHATKGAWNAHSVRDRRADELLLATVVLDAAHAYLMHPPADLPHEKRLQGWLVWLRLVEWACDMVRRHTPLTQAARDWLFASVALGRADNDQVFLLGIPADTGAARRASLQKQYGEAINHLAHLRAAMPERAPEVDLLAVQSRWSEFAVRALQQRQEWRRSDISRLARKAGALHAREALSSRSDAPRVVPADAEIEFLPGLRSLELAERALEPLTAFSATRAEAHLELGIRAFLFGERESALRHFDEGGNATHDDRVAYLARFLRGRVHELQGDDQAAVGDYRAALRSCPQAQSATLALSRLLELQGQREEAATLIEHLLAAPERPDPWFTMLQAGRDGPPDWPGLLQSLRAALSAPRSR